MKGYQLLREFIRDNIEEAMFSKKEAKYKDFADTSRCATCKHFSNNKCDIVEGSIDPEATCDYYEIKITSYNPSN